MPKCSCIRIGISYVLIRWRKARPVIVKTICNYCGIRFLHNCRARPGMYSWAGRLGKNIRLFGRFLQIMADFLNLRNKSDINFIFISCYAKTVTYKKSRTKVFFWQKEPSMMFGNMFSSWANFCNTQTPKTTPLTHQKQNSSFNVRL